MKKRKNKVVVKRENPNDFVPFAEDPPAKVDKRAEYQVDWDVRLAKVPKTAYVWIVVGIWQSKGAAGNKLRTLKVQYPGYKFVVSVSDDQKSSKLHAQWAGELESCT